MTAIRRTEGVETAMTHQTDGITPPFMRTWLAHAATDARYTAFRHIALVELEGSRQVVVAPLADAVFLYHNDPLEFRQNLVVLGFPEAARILDKRPNSEVTRKANFGEILASEYLRQYEGYRIPIFRLRYNPNPESSMKGDDVLAFKFDAIDGDEILVAEAKVRSSFESAAVTDAYDQLATATRPRPKSILFVVTILRKEHRDGEANQVLTFLDEFSATKRTRRYMIFLITGNVPRDPFGCVQEKTAIIENLVAAHLVIADLDHLVNSVFEHEVATGGA